jgi:hypothetical protein
MKVKDLTADFFFVFTDEDVADLAKQFSLVEQAMQRWGLDKFFVKLNSAGDQIEQIYGVVGFSPALCKDVIPIHGVIEKEAG